VLIIPRTNNVATTMLSVLIGCDDQETSDVGMGPLLDQIDVGMDVPRVDGEELSDTRSGEPSKTIRYRVEATLARQAERSDGSQMRTNAEVGAKEVQSSC